MRTIIIVLNIMTATYAFSSTNKPQLSLQKGPWDSGVTREASEQANALYEQGNQFLKNSKFQEAATKYRQAIGHWNHPAVRYNLAKALFSLDEPAEMYENVLEAIKYGPEPISEESYRQALEMKAYLEKLVTRVEVSCEVNDAQVEMDGRPLFKGPGKHSIWARVGDHIFAAKKNGYVTHRISTSLQAGEVTAFSIGLKTIEETAERSRRWSPKMPYMVMGSGAVMALAGGVLHLIGRSDLNSYNEYVRTECKDGCAEENQKYVDRASRGEKLQSVAVGAYIVGGAALITGAVFWWLNRPIISEQHSSIKSTDQQTSTWKIAPMVTNQIRGLKASVNF